MPKDMKIKERTKREALKAAKKRGKKAVRSAKVVKGSKK